MRALAFTLTLFLAAGCSCGADCEGIACEACPPAIQLDVQAPGSTTAPTVAGPIPLECNDRPGGWVCIATEAPVGTHVFEVTLGAESATVTIELEEGGDECCSCPTTGGLAQVDFSDPAVDGGATDCAADLVDFPMGGALEPGTLCDDVFACVPAAAVDSVQASTVFECGAGAGGGVTCAAGEVVCRYADPGGPSTLDADEVANVCALTVHAPPPSEVVCRVYL